MTDLSHTHSRDLLCPFRFNQIVHLHVTEPSSDAASFGTALHGAAAAYVKVLLSLNKKRAKQKLGWLSQAEWLWQKCVEGQLIHEGLPLLLDEGDARAVNNLYHGLQVKPGWTYICEQRLAVNREYKPCGLRDKADKFAGTPDQVAFLVPEVVYITDYKMGNMPGHLPEYDTAQHDQQLIDYGALWCWHHQECEEVHGRQWAPRWNRDSRAIWTRDQICELARERIESDWQKIAWCKKHGWPAVPCERCDWCKLACGSEYWEEVYDARTS